MNVNKRLKKILNDKIKREKKSEKHKRRAYERAYLIVNNTCCFYEGIIMHGSAPQYFIPTIIRFFF